jgi:hypothetical protein
MLIRGSLISIALCGFAMPVIAEPVRHVPPASVVAATAVELVAEAASSSPTMTVHYRTVGAAEFATTELVRQHDRHWVAVVPAGAVISPGLEYYLDAGGTPVFASPASPHVTLVASTASDDRRERDQARSGGRRSRIRTSAEFVNYGTRTVGETRLVDRYYRIDADFAYRLWAYPLEELRVGYTRLVGDTEAIICEMSPCTAEAGFKVAGWFELGLAPVEGVRLDARAMVMATAEGFAVGGRGEARLGMLDASHVAVGIEHMADVGVSGYFRLGWGTVPRLPMAATVEVTNLPATNRDTGVRLYYDLGRELGGGVRVGARFGYAARTQSVAGFTGGGNVTIDF